MSFADAKDVGEIGPLLKERSAETEPHFDSYSRRHYGRRARRGSSRRMGAWLEAIVFARLRKITESRECPGLPMAEPCR